jgi:RecA-family ATPase
MLSRCEVYSSSMGASIKDFEDVIKTIVDAKITDKLLIIDTLSHFINPNDNVDVQKFYNLLQQVKNNGNSVIVLHHTNKGDASNPTQKKEFFGSSVIQAQTDTMLYLDGFDDGDGNIIVTLEPEKKRGYIDKKSYKVSTLDFTIEEVFDANPEQLHKD